MNAIAEPKAIIAQAIQCFRNHDLFENAIHLFEALGYKNYRKSQIDSGTYADFKSLWIEDDELFNEKKAYVNDWRRVALLFQLTREDIKKDVPTFEVSIAGKAMIGSYLYFAIELRRKSYTRSEFSQIAREVNKLFVGKPVILLFKYGEYLTFAIIDRRPNKRDESRDVLEKVTLIKDISINNPNRGHIEILFDLRPEELCHSSRIQDFVDLHQAWQEVLSASELNKKFYRELANWYFWACQNVDFPADAEPDIKKCNATNLIRLITRLIFVWFLKEKGLVPEEFFDEAKLKDIINAEDKNKSTYYKAILQNLFFATLNQEMNTIEKPNNRDFRILGKHHNITNLYRYRRYFKNPKEVLALFSTIPFLNGGLFECLDHPSKSDPNKIVRIDGFSDADDNPLSVPNFLFFKKEDVTVDLSTIYGDTKRKKEKVRGLIDILSRFKFTVTENTPIEEEVALDPELLGKVFENLLATYNPETQTTARKQTGSFYTPREIVDYMVDESLIAYLETKLLEYYEKAGMKSSETERQRINEKLRHLFSYSIAPHKLATEEVDVLIQAIDDGKILDPACGSGAFPMGILHKMVHLLSKLDPQNESWKHRQIVRVRQAMAEARKIEDFRIREKCLTDLRENIVSIEAAFQDNELDYGRKLYLIENCIYGVDIQPIAVQIAKLRFFISLIVEQKVAPAKENLGIRPLPNLETKFVAANSLIGLDRPAQIMLRNLEIEVREKELRQIRESHFAARTSKEKERFREIDDGLRAEIAELLRKDGFDRDQVGMLAQWDPYDQNASADFFDPEWMFGIHDGFDVVIANPPYGANIDKALKHLRPLYTDVIQNYAEIYKMFFKKGLNLLKRSAVLAFITPNTFVAQPRYKDLRKFLLKYEIISLVNLGEGVFEEVIVPVGLSFIKNNEPAQNYLFADVSTLSKFSGDLRQIKFHDVCISNATSSKDFSLYYGDALKEGQVYLEAVLQIKDAGIQYHRSGIGLKNKGGNDLYERLFSDNENKFTNSKKTWYGKLIDRYYISPDTDEFFNLDYRDVLNDNEAVSFSKEAFVKSSKILWRQTASHLRAVIDENKIWFRNTIQCAYIKSEYETKIDISL
ncbi:MAG: hypothetical protein ILNGONEN_00721 [Syntrophorhabdaceae bacterium]|nr:hypothetical protein [Syntrophorhabdaceae bacterium]